MPKAKEQAVVVAVVVPTEATITKAEASKLDKEIDGEIKGLGDQLANTYIKVGGYLKQMREANGFVHLGYESWEAYLDSKREYGRTYLSYLYRLGQAGDLSKYLKKGMSGTKLIEFVKRTDYPEKVPQLIDATWDTVKDKPVRETAIELNKFVTEHPEFRKAKEDKRGGRPKLTIEERLEREYDKLVTEKEQDEFIAALRAFARAKRPRKKE